MAQRHANARQQFFNAKGLRQVIIGAFVQRHDFIAFVVAHRQHDDGHAGPFAQPRADFKAVHVRQTQIEDDHIRRIGGGQRQALFAATGRRHLKVPFGQDGFQRAQNLRLVVDDQNVRRLVHSLK